MLADARQVVHDVDPESLELGGVADAGELEQLRRVDRAAAEDHLARLDPLRARPARDLDPDRARAVEQDPVDERAAAHLEVRSVHHRVEVGAGRAEPATAWMLRSNAAKPSCRKPFTSSVSG